MSKKLIQQRRVQRRISVIDRAIRLLTASPNAFCKNSLARDRVGQPTSPYSESAVRFCITGAICRSLMESRAAVKVSRKEIIVIMSACASVLGPGKVGSAVVAFSNDTKTTTWDAISVLSRAKKNTRVLGLVMS